MDPIALICVGFGKSGTTLVDHIVRQYSILVPTTGGKEPNFFLRGAVSLDAYLKQFDVNRMGDSPILFEASPTYVTGKAEPNVRDIFLRIKRILPNPKILFCLRDPVYRAYSHYIHDLQTFSQYGRGRYTPFKNQLDYLLQAPYVNSFKQALYLDANVGCTYAPSIQAAIEIFGSHNVDFFFLERDSKDAEAFLNRLAHFLRVAGITKSNATKRGPLARIFEGSSLPTYYCAAQAAKRHFPEFYSPGLAPGELLIATDNRCSIVRGLREDVIERMIYACSIWTRKVSAEEFDLIHHIFFEESLVRVRKLLVGRGYDECIASYLTPKLGGKSMDRAPCSIQKAVDVPLTA